MTGLLRTTLFFFLPIFAGLLFYQYKVADRPTFAEQRQEFRTEHTALLSEAGSLSEEWLKAERSGRIEMPESLENRGLVLAEVVADSLPLITIISSPLLTAKNWSLLPDPNAATHNPSNFSFSITPSGADQGINTVLIEETIYQPDGSPARLNLFIKQTFQAADE